MIFSFDKNEEKKLLSLFKQHEINIDYLLYLRDVFLNNPRVLKEEFTAENEYEIRKEYFEKLNKLYPFPNDYIKDNILWDTKAISVKNYYANPYLKAIKDVGVNKDGWTLKEVNRPAYTLCAYQEEYAFGANYALKMGLAIFDKDYNYPSIALYDQEWMSLNQHEIRTMEVPILLAKGKVLTLGLGLGYFAFMAANKEEVKEVHIVEMDLELIKIFNEYLLPLFPHKEKIHIHKADAFHFINNIKDRDYDYIFSDLWHDVSDGLSSYLRLKKVFSQFTFTKCTYWIESSLISYLRLLVIGVMKNEYYKEEVEYNELQLFIKNKLMNYKISNSNDLDSLLNLKGLNRLFFE